ncbi:hypothetical protein VNO77_33988 [Canavalia gladiata]|uniref:Uncharacterized protein n=1 Tax=Canavalia gladiata TaxID=3824 RepID=A0AAN9PY69_CANGL
MSLVLTMPLTKSNVVPAGDMPYLTLAIGQVSIFWSSGGRSKEKAWVHEGRERKREEFKKIPKLNHKDFSGGASEASTVSNARDFVFVLDGVHQEIDGLNCNANHALYPGIMPHNSQHLKASNCFQQQLASYCQTMLALNGAMRPLLQAPYH